MFFYVRQEGDNRVFYGPFFLPKQDLLEAEERGDTGLSDNDREFQDSTDQVTVIDRYVQMTVDC
ncbi:hypothetical protein QTO01_07405 [Vibrio mytili]|uniref:hypothetical protein n=1 Tax=Vibrio mytili TaxID=50718 RepID=UPI002F41565E